MVLGLAVKGSGRAANRASTKPRSRSRHSASGGTADLERCSPPEPMLHVLRARWGRFAAPGLEDSMVGVRPFPAAGDGG
jgi:hypothetical protein